MAKNQNASASETAVPVVNGIFEVMTKNAGKGGKGKRKVFTLLCIGPSNPDELAKLLTKLNTSKVIDAQTFVQRDIQTFRTASEYDQVITIKEKDANEKVAAEKLLKLDPEVLAVCGADAKALIEKWGSIIGAEKDAKAAAKAKAKADEPVSEGDPAAPAPTDPTA